MAALKLSLKDVSVERAENLVDQIQEVAAYPNTLHHSRRRRCHVTHCICSLIHQLCDTQDEVNQTISGVTGAGTPLCQQHFMYECERDPEHEPAAVLGVPSRAAVGPLALSLTELRVFH